MQQPLSAESILLVAGAFFITAIVLLAYTLVASSRYRHKKQQKEQYTKYIEERLFSYLFSDNEDLTPLSQLQQRMHLPLFRKLCVKLVVQLSNSFTADIADKAHQAYIYLKLHEFTTKKLRSHNWQQQVEAIRDITVLQYQQGIDPVKALLSHSNERVQREAFIAVMLLGDDRDREQLAVSNISPDDWSQSILLQRVQQYRLGDVLSPAPFLKSKNERIIMFGIRMVLLFRRSEFYSDIRELSKRHPQIVMRFRQLEKTEW